MVWGRWEYEMQARYRASSIEHPASVLSPRHQMYHADVGAIGNRGRVVGVVAHEGAVDGDDDVGEGVAHCGQDVADCQPRVQGRVWRLLTVIIGTSSQKS